MDSGLSKPLSPSDKSRIWRKLVLQRIKEYLQYDSTLAGMVSASGAFVVAAGYAMIGRNRRALDLLTSAHRATRVRVIRALIESLLKRSATTSPIIGARLDAAYDEYLGTISTAEPHRHPDNLIGTRMLVIKPRLPGERGVVVIDYTYAFPIVAKCFDLEKLCRDYYVVLEPSWIGFCTPEILLYSRLTEPVFVATNEPPDISFLQRISPNFVPVQSQANCWVDHRVFRPNPSVIKDVDISMVSAWATYKRHAGVFAAMRQLRRRGVNLRALLIGYAGDGSLTRDQLYDQAKYFGVADQIEIQENLPIEEVTNQVSRSKVHILWSRREGFNRAIIEAMLAGVPGILRAGHNYGQHYPYITPQAGQFADESNLADVMLNMVEHHAEYRSREWVMENMTPQIATARLNQSIKRVALSRGEPWSSDIVVKTVRLQRALYWTPEDAARFVADYAYLRSLTHGPHIGTAAN
jgi:glycosyltransferase involved in cell wall biosynthesis